MNHPNHYYDKEVVILGLARSGRAVAEIFHAAGAAVIVNDLKERDGCPEADELEALGISVICGHHPQELIHAKVALLIKNPGIPYSAAPVAKALELGIEVVTEVEVAFLLTDNRMIGITGSNGKTTTTTWVGEMLKAGNQPPIIAGNIGTPLCEAVVTASPDQWMVVELSSFQLKGTVDFRPNISCLLNLCETHLDYHGTMEDYIASKLKLFSNQTAEDAAILNWDDKLCRQAANQTAAKIIPFSMIEALEYGVYISRVLTNTNQEEEWITYKSEEHKEHFILKVDEIGLPGRFNVENALAAAAIAIQAGVDYKIIAEVLKNFRGVEHRLEFVKSLHNVAYYNNSKATNPLATIKALEAFDENIILIAGGLDRGSQYQELLPSFKNKVKALVTLGETKDKLNAIGELAGIPLIQSVDNDSEARDAIRQAVNIAHSFASRGDIVLLSPACASWDMFESYEVRGSMFKDSVHTLL